MNIESHQIANSKLSLIRKRIISFIEKNINKISEKDVCDFIISEFKKEELVTDKRNPTHFVVVNENTDDSHWSISARESKVIKKNNLIMIDKWGKLKEKDAVFADVTWMFYTGKKIPQKIQEIFDIVINGRDLALDFIKNNLRNKKLPKAKEVDRVVRNYFDKFNLGKFFNHGTGHSLGKISCHGKSFNLLRSSKKTIMPNIPFTIEPGLYFNGKFGIRSEINCYITNNYELVITSDLQKTITKIC